MKAQSSVVLVALVALGACSKSDKKQQTATSNIADAYDAYRDMQAVVRASPDHTQAQAAALVSAKDAAGLLTFVRDNVAMLPPQADSFFDAASGVRWGARATLRGAAGTPRERAELLAQLYTQSGFEAEVVAGDLVPTAQYAPLLTKSVNRTIQYDIASDRQASWDAVLGDKGNGGNVQPLDADGSVAAAMLAAITPLVTTAPGITVDTTSTATVLVKVTINGQVSYANPNVDGAVFGESYTTATPVPADAVDGERQLTVTLEAARSDRPGQRLQLLTKQFAASDVAGRNLTVAFTTPYSYDNARQTKVGDASVFIPLLIVRGDGLDAAGSRALSAIGEPVTLGGQQVAPAGSGQLSIDGAIVSTGPTPQSLINSVSAIATTADGSTFPVVELRVSATDTSGANVPGLAADAFTVEEDGVKMAAQLRSSEAPAPHVLLLFDLSDSIPTEFKDNASTVGSSIVNDITTTYPNASIRIGILSIGAPAYAGDFTSDATAIGNQLAAISSLPAPSSDIWSNLAIVAQDPNVNSALVISDFDATDTPTDDLRSAITAGPPIIAAPVGTIVEAAVQSIVSLSDGIELPNVTTAGLPAQVTSFLGARAKLDYHLVYRAPTTGNATRNVSVTVATSQGPSSYDVPASAVAPAALSALYLTVTTDSHTVTRTLAGSDNATADDREHVNAALFGKWVLAVEAGPPSLSVLIDEHLAERLGSEQHYDALVANTSDALTAAAQIPIWRTPVDLRFMTTPLPDESAVDLTYNDGLRVIMHATVPVFGAPTRKQLDILPLTPYQTIGSPDAYTATLKRSLHLAVAENARYTSSTWAALKNQTLAVYETYGIDGVLGPQWAAPVAAYGDYHIIAPASGSPVAFFAVHKVTGEVIGGISDGSGGGLGRLSQALGEDESTEELVDRLLFILDVAKRAGEALGYEGVSAWADLEAIEVSLLGSVIELFEGEGGVGPNDVASSLCSAGLEQLAGEIPGFDLATQPFNDLQSLYNALHELFGTETPGIPGLSGPAQAACSALFGG